MPKWLYRLVLALVVILAAVGGHQFWHRERLSVGLAPPQTDARLIVETIKSSEPFIWWEAEATQSDNFPPPKIAPFAPNNPEEADRLSGGQWISADGKRTEPLFLEYTVTVPQGANYRFYTRKFWQHGPFRWRWDDGPWRTVGTAYLMDSVQLSLHIEANWISLGQVSLGSGAHRLRIELTEPEGPAAFDCFVLTKTALQPRGKLQPNQRYRANLADWFVFDPEADPFRSSAIDLRFLNEAIAGEAGFIQARGESFIQPKTGQPVRFWAVNTGPDALQMDPDSMAYMARFLAKHGVNMVRLHGRLFADEDFRTIRPEMVNRLFAFVAAMKAEGIYTGLSIYFPLWLTMQPDMGFAGYSGQHPYGLLFFNPQFQQIYRGWWRSLLATVNPATGKTLAEDPAMAMVELVNEDSYLFWTFDPYKGVPAAQMALLETQFGTWLTQKYGSLAKALAQWQTDPQAPQPIQADQPAVGRVSFVALGDVVSHRESRRSQDTAAFLADNQKQFFTTTMDWLRRDLGYKGLISASNWITADAQILGPLDKCTNTGADFMDRHGYFDGFHHGPAASYDVRAGDQFRDRTALRFQAQDAGEDFNLPIMDLRYNRLPSTITELNWSQPNRFRADFPLLAAAYGSLQDTDGLFLFSTGDPSWASSLGKFPIATPAIMGQFPATALMYRQGLLATANDVVNVNLKTQDVYDLRGAPLAAPQNLDALRQQDLRDSNRASTATLDPLAFLVGKVNLRFSPDGGKTEQVNLAEFINRSAKTIRSATGQLLWNYAQGFVTVNAPAAQGVTGFLSTLGTVKLNDVSIQTDLEYGTILVVALDQQPIAQSRRLLLQVMSEEQNLGWRTTGQPTQTIAQVGNPPIVVRKLTGHIQVHRRDAESLRVTALDWNGYPVKTVGKGSAIALQPETPYYLIEP